MCSYSPLDCPPSLASDGRGLASLHQPQEFLEVLPLRKGNSKHYREDQETGVWKQNIIRLILLPHRPFGGVLDALAVWSDVSVRQDILPKGYYRRNISSKGAV